MPMPADTIKAMIRDAFPDAMIELKDLAGDDNHFRAVITCALFRGKTKVQQHQMVYAALQGKMGNELHALSLETKVPIES